MKKSKFLSVTKLATLSWLYLIVLTVFSVYLTEFTGTKFLYIGLALGIVMLKGQQIIDIFMELKQAPKLWRILLLSYVIVVPLIITFIYLL